MMDGLDDAILLRRYAQQGSEPAFRAIVDRYSSLVYSTCRRQLGTVELAEDCAQAVFLLLSRNAPSLTRERTLAGWLYMTSKLMAKNLARKELARSRKESPLAENLAAEGADLHLLKIHIDDALAKLNMAERQAVILRFFQGLSLSEVGRAQGVSEDAARMRVQRALRHMSPYLAGFGCTPSLENALPRVLEEPPTHLQESLSRGPSAIPDRILPIAKGATQLMASTKLLIVTCAAALLVSGTIIAKTYEHGFKAPSALNADSTRSRISPHAVLYEVKITWDGHVVTNAALKTLDHMSCDLSFVEPYNVMRKVELTPTVQVGDIISTEALVSFGPKPDRLRFAYETGHTVRIGWTEEAGARIIPENQNPAPNEALVEIKASLDDPKPVP